MNWITIIWSMIAAASLVLALVHLFIWGGRREQVAHLAFSVLAVSVAAYGAMEFAMMNARAPAQYALLLRWMHVPVWVLVFALVWFTWTYLHAGRRWLGWCVVGLRSLTLLINFSVPVNVNYREITSIKQVLFLGEPVAVPVGVPRLWMLVPQASLVLLAVFLIDASISVWRRGERRSALIVGGSMALFTIQGPLQGALIVAGILDAPLRASAAYLLMLMAMAYELSRDMLRAAQLAHRLHESERQMELAAGAAGLGFWSWDMMRDEIWASEQARAHVALPGGQRIDFHTFLQAVHPEDRESVRRSIEQAVSGCGQYEVEYRVSLPGGGTRWLAARGSAESANGKPSRLRGVTMDITERKHADEHFRQSEMEIAQLRENLSHIGRVSMMGQLAAALAHELNQPLGAILRNAEAAELVLQQPAPDLEELRAIITDIQQDDHRAGDVIDRLRGLLKRRDIEMRSVDLEPLLREAAALLRTHAAARQVKLIVHSESRLPKVRGDHIHLQQVLINLLLNAMDAVKEETGERRVVLVRARRDGSRIVEVAVTDQGHGIAPDRLPHIFDPFFTTKPEGMGMGLPISRTIIEAHGGRLWAESNPHGGMTFRFTLKTDEGDSGA